MRSTGFRRTFVALSVCSLALTACGSNGDSASGKTRITVNCMPPKSAKVDRGFFEQDIASFEKQNPDIDVVAHDAFPCEDPKTFDAKLAGGQMEDVFYTYFTDVRHVVDVNQAADITGYVTELKSYDTIQKQLRDIYTVDGKIYGIPRTGYSMHLHDMRWTDDSMGSKQLLVINDVQQLMGSGKLGMYLSAPDNIPILVKEKGGNYKDLALAPMPGGKGTLIGGDGYMFSKKDAPARIRAGLKWLDHMFLTPGKGFLGDYVRAEKANAPVGLPEPRLFTGAADARDQQVKKANANVPVENYQAFLDGNQHLTMKIEPPQAQQIYSVLDGAVSAVTSRSSTPACSTTRSASGCPPSPMPSTSTSSSGSSTGSRGTSWRPPRSTAPVGCAPCGRSCCRCPGRSSAWCRSSHWSRCGRTSCGR